MKPTPPLAVAPANTAFEFLFLLLLLLLLFQPASLLAASSLA